MLVKGATGNLWSKQWKGYLLAFHPITWWRHQMESFSASLSLCAGNSPVTGEFPTQRPVTRSFDVFFDLRLNRGLSKQSWGWWFETPSLSFWRHSNEKMHAWQSFLFTGSTRNRCYSYNSFHACLCMLERDTRNSFVMTIIHSCK